jgi:hypothetical protein
VNASLTRLDGSHVVEETANRLAKLLAIAKRTTRPLFFRDARAGVVAVSLAHELGVEKRSMYGRASGVAG